MKNIFLILFSSLLFYTCTSPISPPPPDLIPSRKMTNILVDLHVAEARVENLGVTTDTGAVYFKQVQQAIFKKHGITEAAFHKSYDYYVRNISELDKIYEKVIDSLTVQEVQFGKINEPVLH